MKRGAVFAILIPLLEMIPIQSFSQPLADGRTKFLGCGTSSTIWPNLDKYWNQVTPGNDGKWGSVEGTQGQFNWTGLDKIYSYAINKGFQYKHHNLVWGNQQPSWIMSLDSVGQRNAVENWIKLVGQRYPKMSMVDVVNEPFRGPAQYKNALGGDGKTGWDWVVTAFQWARQYCDPGAKLFINEYNVLHDNSTTNNYIRLIDTLKARKLIDGIGIQGHYFEFRSDISSTNKYVYDVNVLKANLNKLAATGLPVYISEFDIDEPIDSNQVAQYKIYFPIFWDNPGVKGITLWGYVEGDVWTAHPNTNVLMWNGTERPALKWLRSYVLPPPLPALISPVSLTGVPRNAKLIWHSSESATSYGLQIASDSAFSTLVLDLSVTDTMMKSFPLEANKKFYWRVNAANARDTSEYSVTASFTTGSTIEAVENHEEFPVAFQLAQNYPNPFNPSTLITYQVPAVSHVSLKVYDVLGKEVATLVNETKEAGKYSVQLSMNNCQLISGVYFYTLTAVRKDGGQTGTTIETKKCVVMK